MPPTAVMARAVSMLESGENRHPESLKIIIIQVLNELKTEQGENFDIDKVNLPELERRTGIIDDLLKKGITNSSVCYDRLKENGYTGGKILFSKGARMCAK